MNKSGLLLVVSGPSGVGKGTVMKRLFEKRDDLYFSVSATTRAARDGETDGISYHFFSEEQFLKLKDEDGFLESACFCGNYYGTLKKEVFSRLEKGINVILEIEVQGAMQIRRKYPQGVFIYMYPPSMRELSERLSGRGTEDEKTVQKRLETAKWEITQIENYNYLVENSDVDRAAETINSIIEAEFVRTPRCYEQVKEKTL